MQQNSMEPADAGQENFVLSGPLHNRKDTQSATEVLTEVQQRLSKADNGPDKANAMLTLTEAFSRLDALKGFDAMRYAIEALNHVDFNSDAEKPAGDAIVKRTPLTLEGLDFQKSFSQLGGRIFTERYN